MNINKYLALRNIAYTRKYSLFLSIYIRFDKRYRNMCSLSRETVQFNINFLLIINRIIIILSIF